MLACWQRITRPCCGSRATGPTPNAGGATRYAKADFHDRLRVVPQIEKHLLASAGHMLHHDQPEALARILEAFLD